MVAWHGMHGCGRWGRAGVLLHTHGVQERASVGTGQVAGRNGQVGRKVEEESSAGRNLQKRRVGGR